MDVLSFSLLLGGEVDFAYLSICLRLALDVQQADEEGVQQKKELKKAVILSLFSCKGRLRVGNELKSKTKTLHFRQQSQIFFSLADQQHTIPTNNPFHNRQPLAKPVSWTKEAVYSHLTADRDIFQIGAEEPARIVNT